MGKKFAIILKEIPGLEGYLAGDDGEIYSTWTRGPNPRSNHSPRRLSPGFQTNDYLCYNLRIAPKKYRMCRGHVLVALAFHGYPLPGQEVSHEDGNRKNNVPTNLLWKTRIQNREKRKEHGTDDRGAKNSRALLNEGQVIEMKKLINESSLKQREIATMFGVRREFVAKVKGGYRYA